MADSGTEPLPSYDRPPVIEVVCGLQYEPLEAFQAVAFGLLWQRFRDEYPKVEQNPPLAQVIERFGEAMTEQRRVEVSNVPPLPRLFFVHKIPNWLLQIQADRLLHNWRKTEDSDVYPRFPEVFGKFWSAWEIFLRFCNDEKLGDPRVNQLEVTYINHIVLDEGWSGLGATGEVFPDLSWRKKRSFLGIPESIAWKANFAMPDESGRLHVSLRHALRREDRKPVLLCELTARGMPKTSDSDAIRDWFHLGREWIVRGFADLTSEHVQEEIWQKKS